MGEEHVEEASCRPTTTPHARRPAASARASSTRRRRASAAARASCSRRPVRGVAHPPGYGLWLELAKTFALDPSRAARADLMSALCGAASGAAAARPGPAPTRPTGAIAAVVAGGALLRRLPGYATPRSLRAEQRGRRLWDLVRGRAAAHPRDRRPAPARLVAAARRTSTRRSSRRRHSRPSPSPGFGRGPS